MYKSAITFVLFLFASAIAEPAPAPQVTPKVYLDALLRARQAEMAGMAAGSVIGSASGTAAGGATETGAGVPTVTTAGAARGLGMEAVAVPLLALGALL